MRGSSRVYGASVPCSWVVPTSPEASGPLLRGPELTSFSEVDSEPESIWVQDVVLPFSTHLLNVTAVFASSTQPYSAPGPSPESIRQVRNWGMGPNAPCKQAQLCLTLWPHALQFAKLLCAWDFSGKNTEVGCHFLLQGNFLTQGSNPCLLLGQADSLPPHHLGSPAAVGKSRNEPYFTSPFSIRRKWWDITKPMVLRWGMHVWYGRTFSTSSLKKI